MEAMARRVTVLLFYFRQGNRTFCDIPNRDAGPFTLDASPARLDSLSLTRLWSALSDAERDALRAKQALPVPSEENSRRDDETERRDG